LKSSDPGELAFPLLERVVLKAALLERDVLTAALIEKDVFAVAKTC
jgi:hypothetical protein